MDILYIVIPAYNEAENIEAVINEWYPILEGKEEMSRIVVADSGSTDETHNILTALKENYGKIVILSDTEKQHGPKVIALYDYAIKNGADYIFQTDSDGQTNPDEFKTFWELRKENDAIIGQRLSRGDGKLRHFVEKILCVLLKLYFGVDILDANAPFRLMKSNLVKKYLYKLPPNYNLPNVMMTTFFAYYKEKLTFVNITFKPRQGGKSSINIPKIIKTGWNALYDFYRLKKEILK